MALKILTLTWNGKDKIERLRRSLLPILPEDATWLIRDNGSSDDGLESIAEWGDRKVVAYAYPNNLRNYSEGNNWLFDRSEAKDEDLVMLLNNDVVFQDKNSIQKMIDIIENDDEVGVVGAKLSYMDRPQVLQHAGVLFHPANIGTPFHFRAGQIEETRDRQNRYYPIVTGACLLTRASIFSKIRLNEKLQWCWDDSDYCMAVAESGKKIVYCGETNISHEESASLKKNPVNKLFFDQNLRIFMDRWHHRVDKNLVNAYKDSNYAIYKSQ